MRIKLILAGTLLLAAQQASSALPSRVYVSNTDGASVSVIDPSTNTVLTTVTVGGEPRNLAAGDKYVYVPNRSDDTVSVIDRATNLVVGAPITVGNEPYAVAITPDGKEVWVVNKDAGNSPTISIIATATNTVVATIPTGTCLGSPESIAMNPVSNAVYVPDRGNGNVCIFSRTTRTLTNTLDVGGEPRYAVVTPDGKAVYVSRTNGPGGVDVARINTATNAIQQIANSTGTPRNMAITCDGSKIYMGLQDGTNGEIGIVNTQTNLMTYLNTESGAYTYGAAFVPDLNRMYITNENQSGDPPVDYSVYVADAATDTLLTGAGLPITDAGFNTPRAIAGPPCPVETRGGEWNQCWFTGGCRKH